MKIQKEKKNKSFVNSIQRSSSEALENLQTQIQKNKIYIFAALLPLIAAISPLFLLFEVKDRAVEIVDMRPKIQAEKCVGEVVDGEETSTTTEVFQEAHFAVVRDDTVKTPAEDGSATNGGGESGSGIIITPVKPKSWLSRLFGWGVF